MGIAQANVLVHVATIEKIIGERLLERRFPPNPAEMGRTQLTEAGRAFLPKAVEAVRVHDKMFADAPVGQDSRQVDRSIAEGLLELARDALRHDLSDDDRKRIYYTPLG